MLNETGRREKYERQNSDDSDDSDYDWVPISHGQWKNGVLIAKEDKEIVNKKIEEMKLSESRMKDLEDEANFEH